MGRGDGLAAQARGRRVVRRTRRRRRSYRPHGAVPSVELPADLRAKLDADLLCRSFLVAFSSPRGAPASGSPSESAAERAGAPQRAGAQRRSLRGSPVATAHRSTAFDRVLEHLEHLVVDPDLLPRQLRVELDLAKVGYRAVRLRERDGFQAGAEDAISERIFSGLRIGTTVACPKTTPR